MKIGISNVGSVMPREFTFEEIYYDLPFHAMLEYQVRIEDSTGSKIVMCHLPLPWFQANQARMEFILSLPVSLRIRDETFFHCKYCGKEDFRTLKDCDCLKKTISVENENHLREREEREKAKDLVKYKFLEKLDAGETDLGIINPVIVIYPEDENAIEWNLPEIDDSDPEVLDRAVAIIRNKVDEWMATGKIPSLTRVGDKLFLVDEEEKYVDIISDLEYAIGFKIPSGREPFYVETSLEIFEGRTRAILPEDEVEVCSDCAGTSEDECKEEEEEVEPEVIYIEGSPDEEYRRQLNGVWQHKHETYDYWHPMARIHKGQQEEQTKKVEA